MKKIIAKMLIASALLLSSGLIHMEAFAGGIEDYSSTSSSISERNQVKATSFRFAFTAPKQFKYTKIGKVSGAFPPYVVALNVFNGGPTSLSWSAAVRNDRTGRVISEYRTFQHGQTGLIIPLYSNSVLVGDELTLVITNNNLPFSGASIYGEVGF